jgi:DNA modification methylase
MLSAALPLASLTPVAPTSEISRNHVEQKILKEEQKLTSHYSDVIRVNEDLNRQMVSFQGNRSATGYRWFKFKEGYSAALVDYVLERLNIATGPILDPFAGSGTTLFSCSDRGLDAVGVEILPSSAEIIEVLDYVRRHDTTKLVRTIRRWILDRPWDSDGGIVPFGHLRTTKGAFPPGNERALGRFLFEVQGISDKAAQKCLRFAAMCVLEQISYTRKDGQYLRWDQRSGRRAGLNDFDKGAIPTFTKAVTAKLSQIASDIEDEKGGGLFCNAVPKVGKIELLRGSCLSTLSCLPPKSFEALITSPPYCNRYDYTRTYALELAMLGTSEERFRGLRQSLLSCTVENRPKDDLPTWVDSATYEGAIRAFRSQTLLQVILAELNNAAQRKELNNPAIPRMVRGYFEEMSVTIFQAARLLKPGAAFVMVNDNVRYHGLHLPVDLILSDFASAAGFSVESIWVLPRGKGNSSQQMGQHGRQELRKCVYVWRRIA